MIKHIFRILSIFVLIIGFTFLFHFGNSSYAQSYWIRSAGSQMIDEGTDISTDDAGNVTGYFSGTTDFGGIIESSAGITDVFVMKYNTNGVLQWVRTGGGTGNDRGSAIHADNIGNCYVTGYFYGTASFSGTIITSQGAQDIFIAKYDSNGNVLGYNKIVLNNLVLNQSQNIIDYNIKECSIVDSNLVINKTSINLEKEMVIQKNETNYVLLLKCTKYSTGMILRCEKEELKPCAKVIMNGPIEECAQWVE